MSLGEVARIMWLFLYSATAGHGRGGIYAFILVETVFVLWVTDHLDLDPLPLSAKQLAASSTV